MFLDGGLFDCGLVVCLRVGEGHSGVLRCLGVQEIGLLLDGLMEVGAFDRDVDG